MSETSLLEQFKKYFYCTVVKAKIQNKGIKLAI